MNNIRFQNDVLPLKDKLFRLALRITLNREDAEDIVQETMIKVWNRRDSWDEIESMEAFCLTICRNIAIDKTRRADTNNTPLSEMTQESADPTYLANPEQRTVQTDRVAVIRSLVDSLPEKQRTAMQLRDFEGKSYKEIAQIMDVSEDQVKVNIFRARQTIKQKFIETDRYGL